MNAPAAPQAAQQARPAPDDKPDGEASAKCVATRQDDRKSYGIEHCAHCGTEFPKKRADHFYCSDKCRYAEYEKRNPRINKMPPPEEQLGLYPGKVFQVSMRNINLKARSTKGGMVYKFEAEIVEEDFDVIRGHDLTGSLVETQIEVVEIAQKPLFEEPKPKKAITEAKPYGKEAAELYKAGFFFNPHVMEKVGTPEQYAEWVQRQPSAYSGDFSEWVNGEGRCVAAHVRRIAGGAGTGIKNDYAVIPLKQNEEHALQHGKGESALGGKEWHDKQRAKHLSRWMAKTIFGEQSMGYVRPDLMLTWCESVGIQQYLPKDYLVG